MTEDRPPGEATRRVVAVAGDRSRTAVVAAALNGAGYEASAGIRSVLIGLFRTRQRPYAAVTCAPPARGHAAGLALRRLGVPWVADQGEPTSSDARGRLVSRMLRSADVVTTAREDVMSALHERVLAHPVLVGEGGEGLEAAIDTAAIWRRPQRDLRVLVIGPTNSPHVEDFVRALRRAGVEVVVGGLPWGGGLGPSTLPAEGVLISSTTWPAFLWIRRLRRELRPTVVHTHWLPNGVLARLGGAKPLVATAWGSDVYLASRRRRAAYRWLLPRTDMVLADSNELLRAVRALGARATHSRAFSWGVDLSTFSPPASPRAELRRSLGLQPGPVILSLRGFKPIYNPDVVIAAFERLAERDPELQLVMKHNSVEPVELPRLRFPDRVRVVGPTDRDVLADWMRAASVCVSLASSDSSPRSIWEAMACRCACVVSDLPWAHEELEPGKHTLLTPIDADAAAGVLGRVLGDKALADALGSAGRALVEERHDRDAEMQRVIELYREVTGG